METFSAFVLGHEPAIRLGFFAAVLALMIGWEILAPRRRRAFSRWRRWPANLGIVALSTVLGRVAFAIVPVGLAALCETRGWGLLNTIEISAWLKIVAAIVILDLAIYLQHVMFHAVPVLWRLHRMHHSDLDFDVTTGARFHPFEFLLSIVIKFAVIVALGAPAVAVLVFEVLLNASSMFNHANVRLPLKLDKALRWLIVTPDMHRVHHSIAVNETNSNFGFNLSCWDRLLGTYRAQPAQGHETMTIGLDVFRDPADLRLDRMLVQPFVGGADGYPMTRRGGEG
jgi:sterol desaturase/sphingolipid hydroxylase (fatty acid hydroxylase superfamily)